MSVSRQDEKRYLSKEEFDLVAQTHHPDLARLADKELHQLVRLVRERRDKAQDIARRQRREIRGKSKAKGSEAARDDAGSRVKSAILAQAVKRINSETDRRVRATRRDELVSASRRALELKNAAGSAKAPATRTASKGAASKPSPKRKTTTPRAKIGSVSQAGKNAQAKRDR